MVYTVKAKFAIKIIRNFPKYKCQNFGLSLFNFFNLVKRIFHTNVAPSLMERLFKVKENEDFY